MSQSGTFASSGGGGGGGSGTPVQQKRTSTSTATSTTASIGDTTTPTTANTTLLMSVSVTPTSATNTLIFEACVQMGGFSQAESLFLFAGTTFIAMASGGNSTNFVNTINLYAEAVSGTTSATTYAIYYADGTGGSVQVFVNSDISGNSYNGSLTSYFTVTEVVT